MASIKIKYRPSNIVGKQGNIYYQIIHNRVVRQLKSKFRCYEEDWQSIIINHEGIAWDIKCLEVIIKQLEQSKIAFNSDDIISNFQKGANKYSLFSFMENLIIQLEQRAKYRTSETYKATLKSFKRFRNDKDLFFDELDSDIILMYEAYLHSKGISKNTSSFYMRILRASYNRAVEKDLTIQRTPFKHVYTGIDKTIKRAISLKSIKQIKNLDLTEKPSLEFARNVFMFSFYTRGMSFIDIAYLKKKDIKNGVLSYRRHKTGQQLFIKWEKHMNDVVLKYDTDNLNPYLLPIISTLSDNRRQYKNALARINIQLKEIAKMVDISIPLTLYVARHSWASIAKSKNIPISVISEGMGHDSESTTQIYLASLDNAVIDNANAQILKEL